ncbi:hypothetical protein V8G54_026926 [Vigna mungo]|uniref:Uncharacterized protein n=1 Tax=Vigna mungo TaxID=3915 RepID=A0AAQ3RNM5_VIGMU
MLDNTWSLSSTDFSRWHMRRSFRERATAAPMTATTRNLWIGGKRFQARACSALKPPPMVLAELASSALRSLPWSDNHAIGFSDETGRLRSTKLAERRRRETETPVTDTNNG